MWKTALQMTAISWIAASFLLAREYGPAMGAKLPDFALQDQDGRPRTLQSLLGPKGALILFFRSADW